MEDYLEWCVERGKEPEKPFSGKFVLRISPELHNQVESQEIHVIAIADSKNPNILLYESAEGSLGILS